MRPITPTEQRVLDGLTEAGPKGISTDSLLDRVYGSSGQSHPESLIIPVLICNLRKKIKKQGLDIQPIRNFGYRLVEVAHAQ